MPAPGDAMFIFPCNTATEQSANWWKNEVLGEHFLNPFTGAHHLKKGEVLEPDAPPLFPGIDNALKLEKKLGQDAKCTLTSLRSMNAMILPEAGAPMDVTDAETGHINNKANHNQQNYQEQLCRPLEQSVRCALIRAYCLSSPKFKWNDELPAGLLLQVRNTLPNRMSPMELDAREIARELAEDLLESRAKRTAEVDDSSFFGTLMAGAIDVEAAPVVTAAALADPHRAEAEVEQLERKPSPAETNVSRADAGKQATHSTSVASSFDVNAMMDNMLKMQMMQMMRETQQARRARASLLSPHKPVGVLDLDYLPLLCCLLARLLFFCAQRTSFPPAQPPVAPHVVYANSHQHAPHSHMHGAHMMADAHMPPPAARAPMRADTPHPHTTRHVTDDARARVDHAKMMAEFREFQAFKAARDAEGKSSKAGKPSGNAPSGKPKYDAEYAPFTQGVPPTQPTQPDDFEDEERVIDY